MKKTILLTVGVLFLASGAFALFKYNQNQVAQAVAAQAAKDAQAAAEQASKDDANKAVLVAAARQLQEESKASHQALRAQESKEIVLVWDALNKAIEDSKFTERGFLGNDERKLSPQDCFRRVNDIDVSKCPDDFRAAWLDLTYRLQGYAKLQSRNNHEAWRAAINKCQKVAVMHGVNISNFP